MLEANQIAGFLNQPFLQSKSMKQPHFLHVDTKSQKFKVHRKFFGWAWSKMGVANLVSVLNLNVSQEWTDGINWFFACWNKFTQIKRWSKFFYLGMVKNGCGQSGCRNLKLTASQEWTDGVNLFLACWYKFGKAKSWFMTFGWVWLKMTMTF